MASISSDANGTRRLQFIDKTKKRRTLYLGPVSLKVAQTIALRVESLVTASVMGAEPDRSTAAWAAEIGDDFAAKLAKLGLIPERVSQEMVEGRKIGQFLDAYFQVRSKANPATRIMWGHTRRNLVEHFGADRDIATITRQDAVSFRDYLLNVESLGGETAKRRISNARMFFKEAVEQGLATENVFVSVPMPKSGLKKCPRQQFVSSELIDTILPHCSPLIRLAVILARYGGMRCPSEPGSLRWADIDWQNRRMTITSPKTAHHTGGERRECPLFPRVREELDRWRAESPAEAEHVLDGVRKSWMTKHGWHGFNLRAGLVNAIRMAGHKPWPKLFNSLRGSCETDLLADGFPNHVVASWLGHSVEMQAEHYANVRPEDFEKAAGLRAAHKTAHYLPGPTHTESYGTSEFPTILGSAAAKPGSERRLDQSKMVDP